MKSRFVKGIFTISLCLIMIIGNLGFANATVSNETVEEQVNDGESSITSNETEETTSLSEGDIAPSENNENENASLENKEDISDPASESTGESNLVTDNITDGNSTDDINNGTGTVSENSTVSGNPKVNNDSVSENSITFKYDDDEKEVLVTVSEKEFAKMQGTPVLVVKDIEDDQQLAQVKEDVEEKLEEMDESSAVQGLLAYDIHFELDGKEIEPGDKALVEINFKEPVIPEGVSNEATVSVVHINESKSEKEVEVVAKDIQNENAEVSDVSFTTESFSTFTIVWKFNFDKEHIENTEIYCIDDSGNLIANDTFKNSITYERQWEGDDKKYIEKNATEIADSICYQNKITNKIFSKAVIVKSDNQENEIQEAISTTDEMVYIKINENNGKFTLTYKNGKDEIKNLNIETQHIYFIFSNNPSTVETLDTSKDIKITMFDYDSDEINKNGSLHFVNPSNPGSGINNFTGDSTCRFGIVKESLVEGFPVLKDDTSLSYLFNEQEYNGKEYFTGANHLFLKSKFDADGTYFYNSVDNFADFNKDSHNFTIYEEPGIKSELQGQFFPYNKIKNVNNKYFCCDDKGDENNLNYHFGMKMETSFLQPKDGKLKNDQPMKFSFSGDDDMWVFIDNVLVLDIGGIHKAAEGSIDFNTGIITVNGKDEYLKNLFEDTQNGRFPDYSTHELKLFYLERGAAESNLKLQFNLETIPFNTISLKKQICGDNKFFDYNKSEDKFYYDLYTIVNNNKSKYNGQYKINGIAYDTKDNDGKIVLKANQTAEFQLLENAKYYFEEINIDQDKYDWVKIGNPGKRIESKVEIDSGHKNALYTENGNIKEFTVSSDSNILFENHVKAYNLDVEKVVQKRARPDTYFIKIEMNDGADNDNYVVYKGKYQLNGNEIETYNADDCIPLKKDEVIKITGMPLNTKFRITETNAININKKSVKTFYTEPIYIGNDMIKKDTGWNEDPDKSWREDVSATGIITGMDAKVQVINKLLYGKITVKKMIDEVNRANGDPIFTFQVKSIDDETIYTKTVRFTNNEEMEKSVTFDSLPCGEYVVSEKDTLRYSLSPDTQNDVSLLLNFENRDKSISFKNIRDFKKNFSHTDEIINYFTIRQDGSIEKSEHSKMTTNLEEKDVD